MSADLSFNAALLGAAAAWIKKPAAQESTGPSSNPAVTAAATVETGGQARKGAGKQRAGLGHVVEKKKDTTTDSASVPGALRTIIEGNKKRARKEAEERLESAAGQDEEDDIGEPESKVRAFKKPEAAFVKEEDKPSLSEGKKKKKKKNKGQQDAAGGPQGEVVKAEVKAEVKAISGPASRTSQGNQKQDTVKTHQEGEKQVSEAGAQEGGFKKKKTKTRSKQKNIRRDKRPMDKRPEHLRVGGEGHRVLTDETKKRIGMV